MRSLTRAISASALALVLVTAFPPASAHATTSVPERPARPTISHQRVLAVPGTVNARDLGGYSTYDGKSTRWRVLYRSETLSALSPDGVTALGNLGLSKVIDLRTPTEIQYDGADRLPAGVAADPHSVDDTGLYLFMRQVIGSADSAYQEAQLGDGKAEERMRHLYQGFVTDPANRAALGAAIRDVAEATGPMLFHCSAGKDRTGVLADTILRAVGVPAATAESDYLLSNDLRAPSDKALRDQLKAAGYMHDPDLLIPLQEVRSDYLAAFRDLAVHNYGSFGSFLTSGLGLDATTLLRLRSRLAS
ncbi:MULTISPECIES: tyrosine-protein phosphatase [Streptomyces]|uniref:tyrosine-protein phosphatase n=1 Tax=Streptomyces TaxID=1883 RepID=UPI0004CD6671|nr:tyrosine-protein phosphatase [Streptomyces durhamensis]